MRVNPVTQEPLDDSFVCERRNDASLFKVRFRLTKRRSTWKEFSPL